MVGGTFTFSGTSGIEIRLAHLLDNNNVYCLQKGQSLSGVKDSIYSVKCRVVINGNDTKIYKPNGTLYKQGSKESSNILAAILNGGKAMENRLGSYSLGYGVWRTDGVDELAYYCSAQKGVYNYLYDWACDWLTSAERSNLGFSSMTHTTSYKSIYDAAYACAQDYNYKITFYVLYSSSSQNLMVTKGPGITDKPIEVPVQKEWLDNDYGTRTPITVKLFADGVDTKKTLTLKADKDPAKNWKGKFENLKKKNASGKNIKYTVQEISNVPGYETKTEKNKNGTWIITNTLKVDLQVKKEWNDENDFDDMRPATIKVRLYSNNKATDKVVTLSKDDGWAPKSFTDLPLYGADKKLITYSVKEEAINGYSASDKTTIDESTGDITVTITNTHKPNYEGYIEINGNVWKDRPDGKGNGVNGVKEDDESGIEGIKVTLRDKDGKLFDATSTTNTDEKGNYTIKVNYDNTHKVNHGNTQKNLYKLYEDVEKVKEKLKTSYIEFEYDAMKYTTVATATKGVNTSKAKEDEEQRNEFDNTHTTVTSSTKHPDKWTDKTITAKTKDVISFKNYAEKTTIKTEEILKYCNGNGTHIRTNRTHSWKEIEKGNHSCPQCKGTGHVLKVYNIDVEKINNVNLGLFEREQPDVRIDSDISKVDLIIRNQQYTYIYKEATEVTEAEAKKAYDDAYKHALEKGMNEKEAKEYATQEKIKVQFQNKAKYTYRRPINPADIAYLNDGNEDTIAVFVTYEVKVGNESRTLPITVHNITNYYDSRYTLITDGWAININDEFNKARHMEDLDIKVEPGKQSQAIELTYQVSLEAIKALLQEDATLSNAVEIESYSTQYGENTLYAEQRTHKKDEADKNKETVGRAGNSYGGYDYDSHPGNAGIKVEEVDYTYEYKDKNGELVTKTYEDVKVLKATKPEDDTNIAPSFVLCKDEAKVLSGTVYEDTDVNEEDKLRLGNGKNDNEKGIANVKVELLKIIEGEDPEPAYLYHKDDDEETGEIRKIPAITYTDSEGNYSFGSNNSEKAHYGYGVLTGEDYKIRFTYGDEITKEEETISSTTTDGIKLNARNFKSTIISNENEIYDLFNADKEEIPDKDDFDWHLKVKDGYSIAVDDMKTRVTEIDDLQYGNFHSSCNMIAYSKQFKTKIEFDQKTESQVLSDGKTLSDGSGRLEEELMIFDFGIIERAREDIFVETTINDIELVLANGQSLTSGNPKERNLNYAKAIGFNPNILKGEDAKNALDKQLTIEMDTELIQGATLKTTYEIKVTNNSEIDYDYYLGNTEDYDKTKLKLDYYYFGEYKEKDPKIENSINYFVDYIDAELDCTWNNADKWKKVDSDKLKNLVSSKILKEIDNKYTIYTTEIFNDLKPGDDPITEYLTTSKVLSNQDENIYDNHAEILKLDEKVARTITFEDEKRDVKKYKMGNYFPSLEIRKINNNIKEEKEGLHEQDDDRVKIIITPPTGITTNVITYGVIGLIVLIAAGFVIIFIKKKVLTK